MPVSELQDRLREYGLADFNATRDILAKEAEERVTLTKDLAKLEADTKKIDDLTKALDDLAKPKSRKQQLQELVAFAKSVDTEYDRLTCVDLKRQREALLKQKDGASDEARKKAIQLQIDGINARLKALKCSDE